MVIGSDVAALQADLERVPGVSSVRVVAGEDGQPTEVHVLSDGSRTARQVVRDVQSVALAGHGATVDDAIVTVVPLVGADPGGAAGRRDPRARLTGLGVHASAARTTVDVTLARGDREVAGAAIGPPSRHARPRLVAEAALRALERLHGAQERLLLDLVEVVAVGARRLVTVSVVLVGTSDEVLTGSVLVSGASDDEAVVKAVLDATNRRLPHLFPTIVL